MRKPLIVRRIIQQNRSENGAWTQAVMMPVFRTAELQGLNPVQHADMLVKNRLMNDLTENELVEKAA